MIFEKVEALLSGENFHPLHGIAIQQKGFISSSLRGGKLTSVLIIEHSPLGRQQ